MPGPFPSYVPPGVYTFSRQGSEAGGSPTGVLLPFFIGVGQENLTTLNFETIRGSSGVVDQRITKVDVTDRFVLDDSNPDNLQLGTLDGSTAKFQVRNFPIVTGEGDGEVTNDPTDISVTVDGTAVEPAAVDGQRGVVTLQVPPSQGSTVRVTYFFNRTDTEITDDVTEQVTNHPARLFSSRTEPYDITQDVNDVFVLFVDGNRNEITLDNASGRTAQDIVDELNSEISGLTASVDVDNRGDNRIQLEASKRLEVGDGSANSVLGFRSGESTDRRSTFFTYQGPIVDGTDGGIATTDPDDVTVTVDGNEVDVVEVDGQNRAVTLALPPADGSTVEITYFFNAYQDTFDRLPDNNVEDVIRVGNSPDRRDYIEGDDFILRDDRLYWGSASTIEAGEHTDGAEFFDDTQISTTLVDDRIFFEPIERRVDRSQSPPEESQTEFLLGHKPTLGNGRGDVLTTEHYEKISNGRIDQITHRTDLVQIYHGPTFQAAKRNGPVEPVEIYGNERRVVLEDPVPDSHEVFATYYYNRLADDELTLEVLNSGDYTIYSDRRGQLLQDVEFGTTSASDTIAWPSGVEDNPDAFITGSDGVPEVVTVTFGTSDPQPFDFTALNDDPYDIYSGSSDTFWLDLNGTSFDVDLDTAAFGVLRSDPHDSGTTFSITSGENDEFRYRLDEGDPLSVTFPAGTHPISTIADYISRSAPNQTEVKGTVDITNGVSTTTATTYDVTINGNNITEADASLSSNTYSSASALASDIESTFETASGLTAGDITDPSNDFEVFANSDDTVSIVASEELSIQDTTNGGDELETLVGWDGGNVPNNDSYTTYSLGTTLTNIKVARTWEGVDAEYIYLRSRTTPSLRSDISKIEVLNGNANDLLGFDDYTVASGTTTATNKPASLLGESFSATDVSDLDDADVPFLVSIDGTEYEVPATEFDGDSTVGDVQTSIDNVIGGAGAGVATVTTEDSAIRITSNSDGPDSAVQIGNGDANQYIGFSEGDVAFQEKTHAEELAAVLNNNTTAWTDQTTTNLLSLTTSSEYVNYAYAREESDALTFVSNEYGASESIIFESGSNNVLNDTGIGISVGDSAVGVDGEDTFTVTSSKTDGSSGTGRVGQTYTDDNTGLRFTVLDPADGDYTNGDSFTLEVREQLPPNSTEVRRAIPGVELTVDNTDNVATGDTGIVTTYDKSGNEPAIGDFYYVSYEYTKANFEADTFFRFQDIEDEFGRLSPENTLTLASFLAFINGAVTVGCKQLQKQPGTNTASSSDYLRALEELEQPLEEGVTPDLIVPLTTSETVQQATVDHCEVQSSPRRQQERRCILGMASGSEPSDARELAQGFQSERAVLLYPDSAIITLENEVGQSEQFVVNGTFLAAALAGHRANPAFDVAEPITRKDLSGFVRLNRSLSRVQQNRLATAGVTVLEDTPGAIRIRDGLTTDPSSNITRNPSVVAIKDLVNQQTRNVLDSFIGDKFLESKVQDIEFAVKQLLNSLQEQNIIAASEGVRAEPDPEDPTQVNVRAFFSPVFPLKYVKVTYVVQGQNG